jgi:hypothetical protein
VLVCSLTSTPYACVAAPQRVTACLSTRMCTRGTARELGRAPAPCGAASACAASAVCLRLRPCAALVSGPAAASHRMAPARRVQLTTVRTYSFRRTCGVRCSWWPTQAVE